MALNYTVTPGTILKEYLVVRKITQKKMAQIIGMSEKFVSNLINDKARISVPIALKLELVFDDVKAEFWLDLEKHYQLKIARNKKIIIIGNKYKD